MPNYPGSLDTLDSLYRATDIGATTLAVNLTVGALSATVTDGSVFPTGRFILSINDELMIIASRAVNVLTIEARGQFGTTADAHSAGDLTELRVVAELHTEQNRAIIAVETELDAVKVIQAGQGSAISSLSAAIAVNSADIATNVANISANDADISALQALSPLRIGLVRNTDVTTNINQAAFTSVPLNGTAPIMDSEFSASGNGIIANYTGRVRCVSSVHYDGSSNRIALQGQFSVGGTLQGGIASMGYIRNATGHTEASIFLDEVFNVTTGQLILFNIQRESTQAGAANMVSAGTSFLRCERLA